jgi:transcriptional regulator of acetoin/glycerol metabolism
VANPWLALDHGADPAERIRQGGRAHARFLSGDVAGPQIRSVVAESWRRSADALRSPDDTAPIDPSDSELEGRSTTRRPGGCSGRST